MSLRINPAVAALRPYHPPLEGRAGLRLDFNENTLGCSPAVLAALRAVSAEDLARYPEYGEAEAEIAAAFGHSPASLAATNGVDDAIQLAVQTLLGPGDEALIVTPTYAMYRFYVEEAGARLRALPYRDQPAQSDARDAAPGANPRLAADVREFALDLNALRAALDASVRLVFLANPNNPTGSFTPPEKLLELIRSAPDCAFFLDEAYADFVAEDYAGLLAAPLRIPNLLVARTFSKAYGLAGARLGVLAAHPDLMAVLRKAHSPYNVNALALICGRAALRDRAWVAGYRRQILASRALVESALAELGLPWWRSAANFVLFQAGDRADEVVAAFRAESILIRDRRSDLAGGLRLTCGVPAQTERALELLRRVWRRAASAPRPTSPAAAPLIPSGSRARAASVRPVLVFDLDGVLVDVAASYRAAIAATVEVLGGGPVAPAEIQALKNAGGYNNDWDLTAELLRRRGRPAARERVVAAFNRLYWGENGDGLAHRERWLLPRERLLALSAAHDLAIFTGRPRADAEFVLRRFAVADCFRRVVALEDVVRGKPDPEGLRQLAAHFAPAPLAAYFGDTVDDAACARAAGVPFFAVLPPGHPGGPAEEARFRAFGAVGARADVAAALELFLSAPTAPDAQAPNTPTPKTQTSNSQTSKVTR